MATHADDGHGGHAHGAHGHGHVDTSGDKGAAYMGLFGGALAIGGLLYGVVTWTNSRYAHEGGEKPAAAEASR